MLYNLLRFRSSTLVSTLPIHYLIKKCHKLHVVHHYICRVKEVIGYDPEMFYADHNRFFDCLHPAECEDLKAKEAIVLRGKLSTKI